MPNRRIKLAPGHRVAPITSGIIKAILDGGGPTSRHERDARRQREREEAKRSAERDRKIALVIIVIGVVWYWLS